MFGTVGEDGENDRLVLLAEIQDRCASRWVKDPTPSVPTTVQHPVPCQSIQRTIGSLLARALEAAL